MREEEEEEEEETEEEAGGGANELRHLPPQLEKKHAQAHCLPRIRAHRPSQGNKYTKKNMHVHNPTGQLTLRRSGQNKR